MRASSNPPPKVTPCTAAMVVSGQASRAIHHSVNVIQIFAGMIGDFVLSILLNPALEFSEIRSGGKSTLQLYCAE